ncbi:MULTISPECIES: helix-turn-helix domain-containing protein [Bacillus]|uniref:helix-turn-helix domain-containing protein n=1 Tax=Bacillus TaxID=1386 RepID=UPI000310CF8B|nr:MULTISPECIES: helix-turn-helix transcriptional regulator [Bacillus]EKS7876557.1 helix-turn-helix transcriptional regulator [Bacillus cereus]MDX9636760.1 helix-turn-helix transcriptional regulator [Bacillus sp. PBL-C9]MEB9630933.1 helix-turn-helix transcriptional regulator [Bacillus anthracis]OUA94520.1 transcriptional regulator [Bacillus thuringiensis serovar oswaldocruzi]
MKIETAFGITLQKYRTISKLSQEQLALNSGLDRTYISLLERGLRNPTINTIFALAETLKIKPSILVQEVENLTKKTANLEQ